VSHGPERRAAGSVFVGRGDELAALRAAWESASGGSARVVAVEGDPGVGKTALIDRLLAEVSALERFLAGPASSRRRSALMSAARVAAQIAAGRGDADQALRDCDRAAGLARSIGMPLEAARVDLVAARCHTLAGHRAAAERALRSARRQFIALGANAYTGLVDGHAAQWGIALHAGLDPFAQLTLRERDVAQLVCQGLTNRQAADRLYMSPKTVETHLGHVFAKLNVSSRAELRALLDQAA
jgi:DNA-binding CsgD family transcriptional regulator